ncbi:Asp-tRNA(Asn)/Glu-tRNA(Gln) amidotransferase subunit GatC [Lignipirellula cremea]|uniref:Aspartyl/glutamyl-tRNA(Asn/Gln) amidotransferase subunit C n=1 Tax=Lignipirellula cremea TaxID=2528010 RepID=A0A518E303_9BACT|nr:Asp-tRNA(Asn)/Glu-tRNA(Gln) amidotransferase subunit GatC [Lignipirellula cremea]QDU98442.1 Glutamyl-tRNA(Gln) amidotransferase subunit C [Lignipirellula cremea]
MSLSRSEVEKVSLLARLQLTEAELDLYVIHLNQIVGYVELLSELDTTGVEPMAHAIEMRNVLVPDVSQPSLPRDQALANAPKRDEECYRVPAVLE